MLRNSEHIKVAFGIDENLADKQMASFIKKWVYGFDTLFQIFLKIPLLWLFIPIFFILKVTKVGQFLYLQLAINRKIIPPHCSQDHCKINS